MGIRLVHHRALLHIIRPQRKKSVRRIISCDRVLEMTICVSTQTTVPATRPLRAGTLIRISGRMQKLIVVGHVDGAVDLGVGGDRWIDYVMSDIQAFDILGVHGKR